MHLLDSWILQNLNTQPGKSFNKDNQIVTQYSIWYHLIHFKALRWFHIMPAFITITKCRLTITKCRLSVGLLLLVHNNYQPKMIIKMLVRIMAYLLLPFKTQAILILVGGSHLECKGTPQILCSFILHHGGCHPVLHVRAPIRFSVPPSFISLWWLSSYLAWYQHGIHM